MTAALDAVRNAVALVCGVAIADLELSTSFADLGADSLSRVSIADVLEEQARAEAGSLRIDDDTLAKMATLGDLAEYVDAHRGVPAGA